MIDIPPASNSITTEQVFSNEVNAKNVIAGIYYNMVNGSGPHFFAGGVTIHAGLSSDELIYFNQADASFQQFNQNNLLATNSRIDVNLWRKAYSLMYTANASIEGLETSASISDSVKTELISEAKFLRAFINFNLVNLFGEIPLVTSTNWRNTNLLTRTSIDEVYSLIESDLQDASGNLLTNYATGNNEKIIPNKWTAMALLSRIQLYRQRWSDAETISSEILSSGLFALTPDLNNIFNGNNSEAIWQLKQNNQASPYNATPEGAFFIPRIKNSTIAPTVYFTPQFLNSFEPGDQRKLKWIDSTIYTPTGQKYFYPYKYKIGIGQATANGPYMEYYTIFRLSEQYLIRAEARARLNKLTDAIADLNIIRQRAGLTDLPNSLNQQQVLDVVEQERRIELFAEWGHRWLDLKRWGKADAVLGPIKGANWQTTDQLYPIPQSELQTNPNFTQNLGY